MDDLGWSGREFKCRMGCNRLVFVLRGWKIQQARCHDQAIIHATN
jgi:hypothetical protein